MKSLKSLNFKSVYRTGRDDLYKDFYSPAFLTAVRYDRAVGYFSSELLAMSLKGISNLVRSNGKMRLVIGHPLSQEEFSAVQQGIRLKEITQDYSNKLEELLTNQEGTAGRLELLGWLIACNRLEIKFALRKVGMYHEKIGIFRDECGDRIVFQGSANETPHGMISSLNAESISVYKSWETAIFENYGKEYEEGFERLWNNDEANTLTIDVSSETYKRICANAAYNHSRIDAILNQEIEFSVNEGKENGHLPSIPSILGGNPFAIYDHQKDALDAWKRSSFKGILKLATGSGKTITAIYGAIKIFEARQTKEMPLFVVISVPYIELALQWVEILKAFNIHAHKCFEKNASWYDQFKNRIDYFNANVTPFVVAVVVNQTLRSAHFQELITKIDEQSLLLIGDECHNHGSALISSVLPRAYYRMGLSATPFRADDDEVDSPFPDDAKQRIIDYYGDVIAEYSLGDAINQGVLTPYNYRIVIVRLTEEEQDSYEEISGRIGQLLIKSKSSGLTQEDKSNFTRLCGERSRLLGSASNKLVKLDELVSKIAPSERSHTLFYTGEGKVFSDDASGEEDAVIDKVSKVLKKNGWKASQFTSKNNRKNRKAIMSAFKDETINALVAMKVLDEGIDVPACKTAFILASTRNPRQYVQRRGRILRKAEGKDLATIYDFVVLPSRSGPASEGLKRAELERINDFTLLARNKMEVEKLISDNGLNYDGF